MSARRRAGTLAIAGAALAFGAVAAPATALVPTFDRSLHVAGKRPAAAAVGRLDGDARPDVLVANRTDGDLALFRGLGGGALSPAERLPLWDGAYGADLELGDFDGDGDRDAAGGIGGAISVLENDGAGGFARTQSVRAHQPTGNVAVGDLNGDGRDDVVGSYSYTMGDIADAGVLVLLGQADDPATAEEEEPLRQISHEPLTASIHAMSIVDVDGDGHRDLMYGERFRVGPRWDAGATDGVVVRYGDGTGALGPRELHDAGDQTITNYPQHIDVTGDGIKDLVAVHNSSNYTTWAGRGGRAFGEPVTRFLNSSPGEVDSGDFNQDGEPDLVMAAGYELRLFYGDGQGGFDSFALPEHAAYNYDVTVADVDADGRDDIVASAYGEDMLADDSIALFRNTTAVAPPPPPPPPAKQCEDGKDNDGDGKVDAADAGCSSATDDDESDDPAPPPPPPAIPFEGFFAPVNSLPTLNVVNGGRSIPVKFSLDGNRGLDVFAAGYPRSQQIACDSSLEVDGIEETVSAGGSSLTYDATSDRYQYVWKTSKAWPGTCRQLVLKLRDGSAHRASFRFR